MANIKKMTQEQFKTTVRAARDKFTTAQTLLQELSTLTGRSDEFSFSGMESAKKFLAQIKELELASKNVRDAFIVRGKTKAAEECTTVAKPVKVPAQ